MKVLKTDLRNRSVRWFSDSPGPESARSQNEYGKLQSNFDKTQRSSNNHLLIKNNFICKS